MDVILQNMIIRAICSCNIKETPSSFAFMNINKEKLFGNFVKIKNIANINILKCYKKLLNKNGIKRNIGFLIIISIIFFHFICIILFYSKNLNILQEKIKDIIFGIKNWKLVKQDERSKKLKIKKEKQNLRKGLNKKKQKDKEIKTNLKKDDIIKKELNNKKELKLGNKYINKKPGKISNLITTNNYQYFDKKDNNLNPPKKGKRNSQIIVINNYLKMFNNRYENISKNSKNELSIKESIIQKTKEIMAYNDEELNQLSYEFALKYDNRIFCEYYISLIKTKHNLIFAFFYSKDYNSRIIKIDLFFINFVIYFTVNAFFFDDDTMHRIYEDKGKFDFIYQLPQIIYSSMISSVLNAILKLLALSEDYILKFKKNKFIKNLDKRNTELDAKLKIIFLSYFIISLIFLLFFWYYISMFCAIYKNTQIHLIKDTLISFGISMLYPFGIYLLPGFFRIPALSDKRDKKECLYNLSKLVQMI